MANYTNLNITVFGNHMDLVQFDLNQPTFEDLEITITSNGKERHIHAWFKSHITSKVLHSLIEQIKDLSLLIDIDIEPGYAVLMLSEKRTNDLKKLFEISDYRDDDFFNNIDSDYMKKFDKIHLTSDLIEIIRSSTTGKTYLNLLINPNCYINI